MIKESELVNIKCPVCGTPIVTVFKKKNVQGEMLHKCCKCKRYWDVDYTNKSVIWDKGKENSTPIKQFKLDLSTGSCYALYIENTDKALLRREGA